jgi:hypothetical protein
MTRELISSVKISENNIIIQSEYKSKIENGFTDKFGDCGSPRFFFFAYYIRQEFANDR